MRFAGRNSTDQGFRVYYSHHQHLAAIGVSGDDEVQPTAVKSESEDLAFLALLDRATPRKRELAQSAVSALHHAGSLACQCIGDLLMSWIPAASDYEMI